MPVTVDTSLSITFDDDERASPITVTRSEGGMAIQQDDETIWMPIDDASSFIEAVRKWLEGDS